jgi:fagellar hook-basal body proteins
MAIFCQVYQVNDDGTAKAVSLDSTIALQIPEVAGKPTATTAVTAALNLPASATVLSAAAFDPTDSSTYTNSTSAVIYDSLGQSHTLTQYYVKTGATALNSTWQAYMYVDGTAADTGGTTLTFDTTGTLTSPSPAIATTNALTMFTNGADQTQTVTLKFNPATQYASSFQVSSMSQDGATVGQLTNVSIGSDGVVAATYSNGTTTKLGMVALAKFSNPQGLTQVGDTSWKESQNSGEATPGTPNSGTFGSVNSSALESSNTDLSSELVDLISAQRNYQANSRALEVNSTLQDTILQIR